MGRKEDYIDRDIRRSNLSSYGKAIRLQQQYGMSWGEATARAGYDDSSIPVYTPKSEPPLTTEEWVRRQKLATEEKARLEKFAKWKEERLAKLRELLKKNPVDRINELMDTMRAKEQLAAIKDHLWKGVGEVDQDPVIETLGGPHIGVLMLRVPYTHRLTETMTHDEITGWSEQTGASTKTVTDSSTTKDFEDFASVRVGVYLPDLIPEDPYFCYEERIGAQVSASNLQEHHDYPRTGGMPSTQKTYVPLNPWPWRSDLTVGGVKRMMRVLPNIQEPASVLSDLLQQATQQTPLDILSLIRPLEPIPTVDNRPWYKRF